MHHLHGLGPGSSAPSTEPVLRHIHPDDVRAAWTSREAALRAEGPPTFPHRIITATGQVKAVVAAGHVVLDDDGDPVISGHFLDLTELAGPDRDPLVRGGHVAEAYGLTPREVEVLDLIAHGLSNQEIVNELSLSINSVKSYIRSAYRKIGVDSRTQAVLWTMGRRIHDGT